MKVFLQTQFPWKRTAVRNLRETDLLLAINPRQTSKMTGGDLQFSDWPCRVCYKTT